MSDNLPVPVPGTELAADTPAFHRYLAQFGLPVDNIIASTEERQVVGSNLPGFLQALSPEVKRDARYLSKFFSATAIGLFDAALNYIWNEVVLNLRKKVVLYGVDLFFDAAVGGQNRANYSDEDDLDGIKDVVLLNTCLKLELISDVVHKKLSHILTMRNDVAASHPNVDSIGGYELLGWLQVCVRDVLEDRPSESAIHIKALVENLKASVDPLDEPTKRRFEAEACNLSLPHISNLLITLFGLFVRPESPQVLRANILTIAPVVWKGAEESRRFQVGATIDRYRTNLDRDKERLGVEFLNSVNGRQYETIPAKTIQLDQLAEKLEDTHNAWDNFHHEPTVMREIMRFITRSADIPMAVMPRLVKVVLLCRLGNGVSYRDGISPGAVPLYDHFLSMLDDNAIVECILALFRPEINPHLATSQGQRHLATVLRILRKVAVADSVKQVLDYLVNDIQNARIANRKGDFRQLSATLINWQ